MYYGYVLESINQMNQCLKIGMYLNNHIYDFRFMNQFTGSQDDNVFVVHGTEDGTETKKELEAIAEAPNF